MSFRILSGSVFDILPTLKPGSIDVCVTSPPYWFLRSYLPKDHPLKHLELGSEATPALYIENQVKVFRLVRDALADHATLWLNIGDTYSHQRGRRKPGDKHGPKQLTNTGSYAMPSSSVDGVESGSMALIPQRLAIALADDGWIVRSLIVWHKPAPMPASVSGWAWRRCRVKVKAGWDKDHPHPSKNMEASKSGTCFARGREASMPLAEWSDCPGCKKCTPSGGYVLRRGSWRPTSSWEPILMLAKSPNYFCDGEPVKTPAAAATVSRDQYTRLIDDPDEQFAVRHDHETVCDGANLRDVWTIAAEPLKEKHYAAFPTALVEKCLRAGTSAKGCCPLCGKPWVRVVDTKSHQEQSEWSGSGRRNGCMAGGGHEGRTGQWSSETTTIDWRPSCTCPPHEPRPALVLDPFSGSGRTGIAAQKLGLDFVGIELNPQYVEMSERLLCGEMPLFAQEGCPHANRSRYPRPRPRAAARGLDQSRAVR